MSSEHVYLLDTEALDSFALKGRSTPQIANANGLTVRRVMQIIRDTAKLPFDQLRILDFACGEGVYAIEAALRGSEVVAFDVRNERMDEGVKVKERFGLDNLRFEQTDIRNVDVGSYGGADVVLFLGILYHLHHRDVFKVVRNIYDMCRQFVIIDTHIALHGRIKIEHDGRSYEGRQYREHADDDPEEVRRSRLLASLDNSLSFWFTKESLFRLLNDVGFTSVFECNVPLEPFKLENRITIIAYKGEPVKVSSYPWVNDKTEDQIREVVSLNHTLSHFGVKQFVKTAVNGVLHRFGLELRRI
ncbi:MAG: class I SAM-dependent methyltransferase [Planctomycetes bacterium]|nr:class I SAM-dependent methyltransferase [Planctomycetota bacterium]MBL7143369.1 class I SAM-dependent methyltransferase [Phycisphaerae bacterium]